MFLTLLHLGLMSCGSLSEGCGGINCGQLIEFWLQVFISLKRLWTLCGKRLQVLTQWPGRSLKFGNLATKLTIRGNSLVILHCLLSDFFSTALIDISLPSPTLIFLFDINKVATNFLQLCLRGSRNFKVA